MRMIAVFLSFLIFISMAYAENNVITISGKRVIYTGDAITPGVTLTESPSAPANPTEGDMWRDVMNNDFYVYTSGAWKLKKKDANVAGYIAAFKAELVQVTDPHAKEALKMLGKALLKLYNETLP